MKNKFFYYLVVSLCFVGFISCSDDEDTSIQFYSSSEKVNSVKVTSIGEIFVEVRNINGKFTVKSNDESLAKVSINEHLVINIKGVKEGTTSITVTDSENRSATLNVEVITQTLSLLIIKHETLVEALNPTNEDKATIDKIKAEIDGKLAPVGAGFKLLYTSDYAGKLIYYPDAEKLTEKVEGTFKWDGDEVLGKRFLKLTYNDTESVYSFGPDLTTRSSPVTPIYLIADFINSYSQMTKPKITKALGGLLVTNATNL